MRDKSGENFYNLTASEGDPREQFPFTADRKNDGLAV